VTGAGRVLILVENLPVPFDRRVWQEACTLRDAGWAVSVICPTGKGHEKRFEDIDDIHVYRYNLPIEASGATGYALEYGVALFWSFIHEMIQSGIVWHGQAVALDRLPVANYLCVCHHGQTTRPR
jgi:hypothetical protein